MEKRTFIRTLLDIFFENVIVKTITSIVKFCNEQAYFNQNKLKFSKNMPIKDIKVNPFDSRFLFKVNK